MYFQLAQLPSGSDPACRVRPRGDHLGVRDHDTGRGYALHHQWGGRGVQWGVACVEKEGHDVSMTDHDPVIEAYKRDLDRTLLRENLKKTVEERVAALVALQRLADEARRAGREASRPQVTDFARLLAALADAQVQFIIVGGLAATVHGSSRLTQDVDIVYARSDGNLERLTSALAPFARTFVGRRRAYRSSGRQRRCGEGSISRLPTIAGDIDLLGEITGGGGYEDLIAHTLTVNMFGRDQRCLDLPWLIRTKRAAGRPRDLEVIAELELLRDEIDERRDSREGV